MRFKISLRPQTPEPELMWNYNYPLSSAIYRIIAKGDAAYATFLHERGYGKGFKLFTFSQINCPFNIEGDHLRLLGEELSLQVAFHLPKAMESFVKGLFQSEKIDITDSKLKAHFNVKSIESIAEPFGEHAENVIINTRLKPLSPMVAGLKNDRKMYDFLSPEDPRFAESLIYNWRNKIASCYDEMTASAALLMVEVVPMKQPFKSRLMTIKEDLKQESKIRGWMNFGLKVTAEKRYLKLLLNSGAGLYNSMGCGFVEVVTGDIKRTENNKQ